MYIRLGYELVFDVPFPTPMMFMLYVHPERAGDLHEPEVMHVEPNIPVHDFIDSFGNRCARLIAPKGLLKVHADMTIDDTGAPEPGDEDAQQHRVEDLPHEALQFLLGSRYCETDRMSDLAWQLFGQAPTGYRRVQAICDWIQQNIEFGYKYARSTKTAFETYSERTGVCRDFMHLACTFCRCLNIPARYATGYLGDIGVPTDPSPMDFSAFFEVYLDGRWWPFDARHNQRRIGRVMMAHGRDATDVALSTSFGPTKLKKFTVITEEIITS
ncbi:MAG: transglutaminase family protein [Phycisphaerae bacterium]|nr:transglutaminase family protein [Phycisphaerae bacterium]